MKNIRIVEGLQFQVIDEKNDKTVYTISEIDEKFCTIAFQDYPGSEVETVSYDSVIVNNFLNIGVWVEYNPSQIEQAKSILYVGTKLNQTIDDEIIKWMVTAIFPHGFEAIEEHEEVESVVFFFNDLEGDWSFESGLIN